MKNENLHNNMFYNLACLDNNDRDDNIYQQL
jgi:hypothetical protein